MKFIEAKEKLKIIANGKYYSLTFHFGEHSDGTQITNCDMYIDGVGYSSGVTWTEALDEQCKKNKGLGKVLAVEEMPDI